LCDVRLFFAHGGKLLLSGEARQLEVFSAPFTKSADTFIEWFCAVGVSLESASARKRAAKAMGFIVWNDRLSVDVVTIDREHREWIGILNDLYDAVVRGAGHEAVSGTLARLTQYTEHHFQHEEALFCRTPYPDSKLHRRQHAEMIGGCRNGSAAMTPAISPACRLKW
jgi:hemerythrin